MRGIVILFIILFGVFKTSKGQEVKNQKLLNIELESAIIIKGTSNLHDWESIAEKTKANMIVGSLTGVPIETLTVNVDVFSIKSGRKVMDKITHNALKATEHPVISFVFKEAEIIKENEYQLNVNLTGNLSVAGITKKIAVATILDKLDSDVILRGNHKLKMTDFGITPPTALLGSIKTGDEIEIQFHLKFK